MSPYSQLALIVVGLAVALTLIGAVVLRRRSQRLPLAAIALTLLVMLTLTLIFDNIMIAVDLCRYPEENFSNITLGLVPLEDFSYPIFTALVLPMWFEVLNKRFARQRPPQKAS